MKKDEELFRELCLQIPRIKNACENIKLSEDELKILLSFLRRFQNRKYKERIISQLRLYKKNYIASTLLDEFTSADIEDNSYRWNIAEALYTLNKPKYINEYNRIVCDKRYGKSRQMMVLLLGRIKSESSVPLLLSKMYEEDHDILPQVIYSIGKYKKAELDIEVDRFAQNFFEPEKKKKTKNFLKIMKTSDKDYEYIDIDGYIALIKKEVNNIRKRN